MSIVITPIPSTIELAAPAFQLGTTNTAGGAATAVSSNSTLLTFDAVAPATVAASAVVGTATVASRRDHVHTGVSPAAAVFTGNADLGSNLLVGNGGSTGIAVSSDGEVTMAAQPAFFVRVPATISNVTGGGTNYTIVFATEVFDQNGDFDGTSTFTAPVTGRYRLSFLLGITAVTSAYNVATYELSTSNREISQYNNPWAVFGTSVSSFNESLLLDMDANDTAVCKVAVSGGSDILDIFGGVGGTLFCGELVV